MFKMLDEVKLKDGFVGKITGINHVNPLRYDVTELERPYKRINGVPESSILPLDYVLTSI